MLSVGRIQGATQVAAALAAVVAVGALGVPRMHAQAPAATTNGPKFEVASIRPADKDKSSESLVIGSGCDGGFPRIEGNRFVVTTTLYSLIGWAYGFNKQGGCSFVSIGNFLSCPDWVKSTRFDLQALMPDGSPAYTDDKFLEGNAPQLEAMIRNLLADRFKLALHRRPKMVPVLALVPGPGGPKVARATAEDESMLSGSLGTDKDGHPSAKITGKKMHLSYLALMLTIATKRPVLDRTNLTGDFNFEIDFAPPESGPDAPGPSIFTAVQKQLGLKLKPTKGSVDTLVIDHVEAPTPN
jgi:uncharacterized protein (TIGR03435 family)